MDKLFKPELFTTVTNTVESENCWRHWKRRFEKYLTKVPDLDENDKLDILINHVGPNVFNYISDIDNYNLAIRHLDDLYLKPKNDVFGRFQLSTCKQLRDQSIDEFVHILDKLAKNCEFHDVKADEHRSLCVRDAFISGLKSGEIRQRLLEVPKLTLLEAVEKARTLESAQSNAEAYRIADIHVSAVPEQNKVEWEAQPCASVTHAKSSCFFCGRDRHPRSKCPARLAHCRRCNKIGHFSIVCRSDSINGTRAAATTCESPDQFPSVATLSLSATKFDDIAQAKMEVQLNDHRVMALLDTGSGENFIDNAVAKRLSIRQVPFRRQVCMASTEHGSAIYYCCVVNLSVKGVEYKSVRLLCLNNLCSDIILGHPFLSCHQSVTMKFQGERPPLTMGAVCTIQVQTPSPFSSLTADCHPIAVKSRRYAPHHMHFIKAEISRMLKEGVIERCQAPWRAQVVVVGGDSGRRRLVVDYATTINKFTLLDAYPLPRIDTMAERISQYSVYSKFDLKSAYHQLELQSSDRKFTAFEADGSLYQFRRLPFGLTNAPAVFQRVIDQIIRKENLEGTFAYLDDLVVCGSSVSHHDKNLNELLKAIQKYNITLNKEKCQESTTRLSILGYVIEHNRLRPDPERTQPLRDMKEPTCEKEMKRLLGMLAHYSRWIKNYSERIRPLIECQSFPLQMEAMEAFQSMCKDVMDAVLTTIDPNKPLTVETDASNFAIGAVLSQEDSPVAFFSRTLQASARAYSSVEKEALAIVEALKSWRHYLLGRHFRVITDQRSISFIFKKNHRSQIKNEKLIRWKMELAAFSFDLLYRPGSENITADALSRITCSTCTSNDLDRLREIHDTFCHPGVTRLYHFVKTRNLPYSLTEVRQVISNCQTCAKLKPQYYRLQPTNLIKATRPFERISMDFKGPLPSHNSKRYLLTIIDEFSRYPFAFACHDMSADTVVRCLNSLFFLFGLPECVHCDQGPAFIARNFRSFLIKHGITLSHSSPYNPTGNSQIERTNGTIWRTIEFALSSRSLDISQWQQYLPIALHSMRSLLCVATNCTPHERFFKFERRTSSTVNTPDWLLNPGLAVLKRHATTGKYDDKTEVVKMTDCNAKTAQIERCDGTRSIVSLKHLAPFPNGNGKDYHECQSINDGSNVCDDRFATLPEAPLSTLDETASTYQEVDSNNNGTGIPSNPSQDASATRPQKTAASRYGRRVKTPEYLRDYDISSI